MRNLLLPALGLWLASAPAYAASFTLIEGKDGKPGIITIDGDLELGDESKFNNLALKAESAIVVLNSPGGNLVAGLRIGKNVRLKEFTTLVPENMLCASACALAWLGGQARLMAPTAKIGFHAAFSVDGDEPEISGMGNALVGAYLNSLGLPERAVIFITKAPPQGMSWLSLADAGRHGIAVSRFDPTPRIAARPEIPSEIKPTAPAPVAPKPIEPTPTPAPATSSPPLPTPLDTQTKQIADEQIRQGYALLKENKRDAAWTKFNLVIRDNPNYSGGYAYRGFWYLSYYMEAEGMADINKAISIDKTYHESYGIRIMYYCNLARFDQARRDIILASSVSDAFVKSGMKSSLEKFCRDAQAKRKEMDDYAQSRVQGNK